MKIKKKSPIKNSLLKKRSIKEQKKKQSLLQALLSTIPLRLLVSSSSSFFSIVERQRELARGGILRNQLVETKPISESLFVRVILWPFSNHVLYNFLIHVRESTFVQLFLEIIILFFFLIHLILSFSFSL